VNNDLEEESYMYILRESSDGEILPDVNVGIICLGSQVQNHLSVLSRDKRVETLTWSVEEEDQSFIDAVIEKKCPPVTV